MAFDLILVDGKIWTENRARPEVEALGITGNRIRQLGSSDEILSQRDARTRVIQLNGRRVVPGFNDAHVHFYLGGASLDGVQLRAASNLDDFEQRIAQFARTRPKGEWILFGSWDPEGWDSRELPNRRLIDGVTPDHPVFVSRTDAHTSLANSLAMRLAGVDRYTRDVPGGEIGRDGDANPTGIFKDAAQSLITRVIPPPTKEQITQALKGAQTHAAQYGVTSVHDMGLLGVHAVSSAADLFRAYQELDRDGLLGVRVALHTPFTAWRTLVDLGVCAGFGNERIRIGGVKAFADGSLGSSTAWFFEPYCDAPSTCGIPSEDMSAPDQMLTTLVECDRAGLQLAVHAIGDRANHQVLDFFEQIERKNGRRARRWRIEHAQHVSPSDLPRFANHQVIGSVQPYHLADDGRWADSRVGTKRSQWSFPYRSLLDAGAVLALGSDWWVAPINPLLTIHAAVTRETLDESHPGGWVPEQKISVIEAVHAYTVGSAYASGEEFLKGSLETGKLADIVILSDDIFDTESLTRIKDVQVDMTIFDGRVIYERNCMQPTSKGSG